MRKISYLQLEDKIMRLVQLANLSESPDVILDLPNQYATEWSSYIGKVISVGTLVTHKDVKYMVLQTVTPIESQSPDMQGMLAIYKPYQGRDNYPWVYGEFTEIGFTRYHNGKLYKAIGDPNANIYSPDQVPAIWSEITD